MLQIIKLILKLLTLLETGCGSGKSIYGIITRLFRLSIDYMTSFLFDKQNIGKLDLDKAYSRSEQNLYPYFRDFSNCFK